MLTQIFVLTLCISCCLGNKFQAAKIPQCYPGDSQCLKDVTNLVISQFHFGEPKIALSSFDPVKINRMSIKQGGNSPVNVEINFNNVQLHGLRHFVCTSFSGFGPDPNGHYEMRFTGPQFVLEGPYSMKGQILILPVQGQGNCNFTLENPELFVRFTGKSKVKNGKTHLYTDDLRMTFKITRMYSHFENLFNGDRALGETTNRFLNENWHEIFQEIKGSIFDAFSLIMQGMLNNMWSHHDYYQLFKQ